MIKVFWQHLSKHRQRQFWLLLALMIFASLTEIISIGAVLPFLAVLSAPEQVFQNELIQPIIQILGIAEPQQLILPLTIIFIATAFFTAMVRLILLYAMTRLSFATCADISNNIYRATLYQSYAVHTTRNSSKLIDGLFTKASGMIGVIQATLRFISSIILIIGVMSALLVLYFYVALVTFISFGLLYWLIILFTKTQLRNNSQIIAIQNTNRIKSLQEGLGGIRNIIIDGTQEFFCRIFRNADFLLYTARVNNIFIAGSPKFIMEAIGMTLIASIAFFISREEGGMISVIPLLGTFALGAQRLLPAFQQSYAAYALIKGFESSFLDVMYLLNQTTSKEVHESHSLPLPFEDEIKLTNLNFRYKSDSPWVLKNINLTIKKGSHIGFIGSTGSGKSTLVDIIMGLLVPTTGKLCIDGTKIDNQNYRQWQANIAHVPQSIYLSDSTIEENIAFGIPKKEINLKHVKIAAKKAKISDLIEGWSEGYQTFVGERGIRLSGGQRQRIGIARALYKQANVLIFDEATSALDNETEAEVMEALNDLRKEITVFIIAHRLTTLKGCDQIIEISKKNLIVRS